jgi:hypothetical protein
MGVPVQHGLHQVTSSSCPPPPGAADHQEITTAGKYVRQQYTTTTTTTTNNNSNDSNYYNNNISKAIKILCSAGKSAFCGICNLSGASPTRPWSEQHQQESLGTSQFIQNVHAAARYYLIQAGAWPGWNVHPCCCLKQPAGLQQPTSWQGKAPQCNAPQTLKPCPGNPTQSSTAQPAYPT